MSSDEVQGILVGHGHLAEGLLDALEEIAGSRGGVIPVNNQGLTPQALEDRLQELAANRSAVIFVDLPSGSCAFAARRLQRSRTGVAIVSGVNLPLLLDFVFHRELPLADLVDRLRIHHGIKIEHQADANRSVSGR